MPRRLPAHILISTGGDIGAVRNHILDVAYRVISSRGLAAASTRAIAAEAGVASGTLYNYFDNRLQLLAQCILRRAHVLALPLADLPSRSGRGTVANNLRYFALQFATIFDELAPLTSAAFSDKNLHDALHHEMIAENPLTLGTQVVERYLLAERELGRVSPSSDCHTAASIVMSLCHDYAVSHFLRGETGNLEQLYKEIDLITHAITTPQPP